MIKNTFIKTILSPFKTPAISIYFGKTQIGVPYFLPRKFVRMTNTEIETEISKRISAGDKRSREDLLTIYGKMTKSVPKKIGFDYCRLGWKTKWSDTDIRFEWPPKFSFVFFGYQIAVTIKAEYADQYWSSFIYYELYTDKSMGIDKRIEKCKIEFSQTYKVYSNGVEQTINYYDLILEPKWRDRPKDEIRDEKIEKLLR